MSKATVLCPSGHRVSVQVSRHSLLAEVLTEVCQKRGLDSATHALFHQGRKLDLSLSLHLENLAQNCLLEMCVIDNRNSACQNKVKRLSHFFTHIKLNLECIFRLTFAFSLRVGSEQLEYFHQVE